VSSPVEATHPERPDESTLKCVVDGNVVHLSWNIAFFAPINGWIVERDGVEITKLSAAANGFVDSDAPDGERFYRLLVINFDGQISEIGTCTVAVGDFGVRCHTADFRTDLHWGPILIDVHIERFDILRDGEVTGSVPGEAREFTDFVPHPGKYRYTVLALTGPDHHFLIGACTAQVPSPGFECRVDPPLVKVDWSRVPLPEIIITSFAVFRDNTLVALTKDLSVVDKPGAGRYHYRVFAFLAPLIDYITLDEVLELTPDQAFLVGECRVAMPGDRVPPPRDLRCSVVLPVDPIPEPVPGPVPPLDPDLALPLPAPDILPAPSVILSWTNPVTYDRILILRNGAQVSELPGQNQSFIDVPPFASPLIVYGVVGVVGDRPSVAAECDVEFPGPPRNVLFFSGTGFPIDPIAVEDKDELLLAPDGRLDCLASHQQALQGWSFGVCSDPSLLAVADATIEGTDTAELRDGDGPSFLSISRFEEGVTMAAIVDESHPNVTLPPGTGDRLLRLRYEAGADASPLGTYPVTYCHTLGTPPVGVLFVVGGFDVIPETRPGFVLLPGPPPIFVQRGDANGDRIVAMSDAIAILNWLFLGGPTPGCLEQADINGTGGVSLADSVYELQWEFAGGPPPPAPFPACGPSAAPLGSEEPSCAQP
jgi:hypothetical protein